MTKSQFYKDWFKHGLNKYELDDIYSIIDKDEDGLLSVNEYKAFYEIFLDPFQNDCDKDNDYLLSGKELTNCLNKAEWFSYFAPTGSPSDSLLGFSVKKDGKKLNKVASDIIYAADSNADNKLNFAEYMFLRKAAVAWKKCVPENMMAQNEMKCAIEIASNARFMKP
jgi:hypothetical protein